MPNSDLVVKEVINWTLSSLRRRVDIPVGIAYGTDPERVIALLVELASAHPSVIHNPKPAAFFLGFGESGLNFELRFWTYQEAWFQLKSDVAVRLVKALREANIEIPFPSATCLRQFIHLSCQRLSLPKVGRHDLRHTSAVLLTSTSRFA